MSIMWPHSFHVFNHGASSWSSSCPQLLCRWFEIVLIIFQLPDCFFTCCFSLFIPVLLNISIIGSLCHFSFYHIIILFLTVHSAGIVYLSFSWLITIVLIMIHHVFILFTCFVSLFWMCRFMFHHAVIVKCSLYCYFFSSSFIMLSLFAYGFHHWCFKTTCCGKMCPRLNRPGVRKPNFDSLLRFRTKIGWNLVHLFNTCNFVFIS